MHKKTRAIYFLLSSPSSSLLHSILNHHQLLLLPSLVLSSTGDWKLATHDNWILELDNTKTKAKAKTGRRMKERKKEKEKHLFSSFFSFHVYKFTNVQIVHFYNRNRIEKQVDKNIHTTHYMYPDIWRVYFLASLLFLCLCRFPFDFSSSFSFFFFFLFSLSFVFFAICHCRWLPILLLVLLFYFLFSIFYLWLWMWIRMRIGIFFMHNVHCTHCKNRYYYCVGICVRRRFSIYTTQHNAT